MPVFHTKTIESILEPVAQQVSKLVLLHEDVENGSKMPDLSRPVAIVKMAADNLIKVGYETVNISDDMILKNDMPLALNRVEEACASLLDASELLKKDPISSTGKRKLIDGERGILQGVSAILLTFDESEVRKIVKICNQVLEYLLITEVIEKMEDLVTYVKNLTPILTQMTREVSAREKELTHQIHREILVQCLDEIKNLTPAFISSIKIYLTIKYENDNGLQEAEQNRDFIIKKMCAQINEIIRVLQLTTYEEDDWIGDDITFMKKRFANFENHVKQAHDWLNDSTAIMGGIGEKSYRYAIDDALAIADKIHDIKQKNVIYDECDKLDVMQKGLHKLLQDGNRNSVTSIQLTTLMNNHLCGLSNTLKSVVENSNLQNIVPTKPAHTLSGKIDQVSKWCNNPLCNDNGLGEEAARLIIEEARKLSTTLDDPQIDNDLYRLCNDCEKNTNTLAHLRNNKVNDIETYTIGKNLQEKINNLGQKIIKAIVQKVANDFFDINNPLRKLSEIALSPLETPNRDKNFQNSAQLFQLHTEKLCETAKQIGSTGLQSCNKRTNDAINQIAQATIELTPQVINAAHIVFKQPTNKVCIEHFELMQKQWQDNMERLRCIVDANVDPALFIKSCENSIINDTYKTELAAKDANSYNIVTNASNIARKANRIVQIASQEAENSEDVEYVEQIKNASNGLISAVPTMIHKAKVLATEPNNLNAFENWSDANQNLIDSVVDVRKAISNDESNNDTRNSTSVINMPQLDTLNISKEMNQLNPIPLQPTQPTQSQTIIPDIPEILEPSSSNSTNETDDDSEIEFPMPQSNQPILMAAHDLHINVDQWSSRDNDLIAIAKRITVLMAKLNDLVKAEGVNKKDLISTAKELADESMEITKVAKELAKDCTDKRMRNSLLQVCERIPTIGTQLKILSTVKATMFGSQCSREDDEATEMLITNAQNLNASVKETVQLAKAASIKIRTDSGLKLRWVRKKPSFRRN